MPVCGWLFISPGAAFSSSTRSVDQRTIYPQPEGHLRTGGRDGFRTRSGIALGDRPYPGEPHRLSRSCETGPARLRSQQLDFHRACSAGSDVTVSDVSPGAQYRRSIGGGVVCASAPVTASIRSCLALAGVWLAVVAGVSTRNRSVHSVEILRHEQDRRHRSDDAGDRGVHTASWCTPSPDRRDSGRWAPTLSGIAVLRTAPTTPPNQTPQPTDPTICEGTLRSKTGVELQS